MPYRTPRKTKGGFVLPKKSGGLHKSSKGKVVKYETAEKAQRAANAIMASEHGWKPTRQPRKK